MYVCMHIYLIDAELKSYTPLLEVRLHRQRIRASRHGTRINVRLAGIPPPPPPSCPQLPWSRPASQSQPPSNWTRSSLHPWWRCELTGPPSKWKVASFHGEMSTHFTQVLTPTVLYKLKPSPRNTATEPRNGSPHPPSLDWYPVTRATSPPRLISASPCLCIPARVCSCKHLETYGLGLRGNLTDNYWWRKATTTTGSQLLSLRQPPLTLRTAITEDTYRVLRPGLKLLSWVGAEERKAWEVFSVIGKRRLKESASRRRLLEWRILPWLIGLYSGGKQPG